MGVPARHALVDLAGSFDERHMVRSYEAVARVSHFRAASEVDTFGGKRVVFPFRGAAHHRQVETGECRLAPSVSRGRLGDASETQIELRMWPVPWRLGHECNVQRQVVDRT
jgi:hypothetical protein